MMEEAPGSTSIPEVEGRELVRGASEKGSPPFSEEGGTFTLLTSGIEEYSAKVLRHRTTADLALCQLSLTGYANGLTCEMRGCGHRRDTGERLVQLHRSRAIG